MSGIWRNGIGGEDIRGCEHEEICTTGKTQDIFRKKRNKPSGLSGTMLGDFKGSQKIFSYVCTPWGTHSLSWFNPLKSFKSIFCSLPHGYSYSSFGHCHHQLAERLSYQVFASLPSPQHSQVLKNKSNHIIPQWKPFIELPALSFASFPSLYCSLVLFGLELSEYFFILPESSLPPSPGLLCPFPKFLLFLNWQNSSLSLIT